MKLFNLLKNKIQSKRNNLEHNKYVSQYTKCTSIEPDEKPFYQPDDYYTFESYPGTSMAQKVITFEERKKTTFPSANGLYIGEIMLLEYCDKGTYPKPKNGYPGFWWFKYGIRDIGSMLKTLEQRGFIEWASKLENLKSLTITELKKIANNYNIKTNQKKEDLINDIRNNVNEDDLPDKYFSKKYKLTKLGQQELHENEYVIYMHKHKFKTTEKAPTSLRFTIWDMNKLLSDKDKSKWREIISNVEKEKYNIDLANGINTSTEVEFKKLNDFTIKGYKASGIEKYQILTAQDNRTCEKCKQLEGKIFKVSYAKLGINVPPFHSGCRCTTIAYFDN